MSLRKKLLLIFIVLSLFPVAVLGILSFRISANIIKESEIAKQIQFLDSIEKEIRDEVYRFQLIGIKYLLDTKVQDYVHGRRNDGWPKGEFEVSKLLQDYKNTEGTHSTYLVVSDGKVLTNRPDRPMDLASYERKAWFHEASSAGLAYFWGEPEADGDRFIPCVRSLTFASNAPISAYLVINVRETEFRRVFSGYPAGYLIDDCIVNDRGTMITHTDPGLVGGDIFERYRLGKGIAFRDSGFFESRADGTPRIFVYNRDDRIGWTHLRIIPVRQITARAQNIKNTTILISVLCLLTATLISLLLSQNIIQPVKRLIATIQKNEAEIAGIGMLPSSTNEIRILDESFELLMRQLKRSVDRSITMANEKRVAELRMLEYQINPHFLYNTLSTIMWLAHANKSDEVIRVTDALASFFRLSLNRGRDFYSVADEVSHVRSFLAIEETRFPEEFSVSYEISPDVLSCRSIKLVLQPIVENALQHGLADRSGDGGRIIVRAERLGGILRYTVMDNGDSMTRDEAREISRTLSEKSGVAEIGVGLQNVHDRISLFYGEGYGVSLDHEDGWTSVFVSIPYQEGEGNVQSPRGR